MCRWSETQPARSAAAPPPPVRAGTTSPQSRRPAPRRRRAANRQPTPRSPRHAASSITASTSSHHAVSPGAGEQLSDAVLGPRQMPAAQLVELLDVSGPVGGVLTNRLEHAVPRRSARLQADQVPVDQLTERLTRSGPAVTRDGGGGFDVERGGEHGRNAQESLLLAVEQVVAPVDRGPQRAVPLIESVTDGEQLMAGRQDPPEAVHAEAGNSCGRQLDRQGHPVEVRGRSPRPTSRSSSDSVPAPAADTRAANRATASPPPGPSNESPGTANTVSPARRRRVRLVARTVTRGHEATIAPMHARAPWQHVLAVVERRAGSGDPAARRANRRSGSRPPVRERRCRRRRQPRPSCRRPRGPGRRNRRRRRRTAPPPRPPPGSTGSCRHHLGPSRSRAGGPRASRRARRVRCVVR